eukprot:TRINITY_DN2454_c0_g1_i1.p1 TRINITY_DN2454_c0_g1~~TRINITY_DN2454_c0_g1_i1.p1  ORF type:complete len:2441 (+),score=869.37 TRINITY_DN2454_c0_g1_i1:57-7379(+)
MALAVKIHVVAGQNSSTKILKFPPEMSIHQVLKEIKEKTNVGGDDFGLFMQGNPEKRLKPKWLDRTKSLKNYFIKNNDEMFYKKKHRRLQIVLADDSVKTVLIDDSAKARDVVKTILENLALKTDFEAWGLRKLDSSENQFLFAHLPLHEQDVTDTERLIFEKKLFDAGDASEMDDPAALHMTFIQAKNNILSGRYPCQRNEAISCAAMLCQINYGDYDASKYKAGTLDLNDYMPEPMIKKKAKWPEIEKAITHEHKNLAGTSLLAAKRRYLQLVKSLKAYGTTYFRVKERNKEKGDFKDVLLGFTKETVTVNNVKTLEPIRKQTLFHMKKWAPQAKSVVLDFGDWEPEPWVYYTEESIPIVKLIEAYVELYMKLLKDESTTIVEDDVQVAEESSLTALEGTVQIGYSMTKTAPIGEVMKVSPSMVNYSSVSMKTPMAAAQTFSINALPTMPAANRAVVYSQFFPEAGQINVVNLPSAHQLMTILSAELRPALGKFVIKDIATPIDLKAALISGKDVLYQTVDSFMKTAKMNPGMVVQGALNNNLKEMHSTIMNMAAAAKSFEDLPALQGVSNVAKALSSLLACYEGLDPNAPPSAEFLNEYFAAERKFNDSMKFVEGVVNNYVTDTGARMLVAETVHAVTVNMEEMIAVMVGAAEVLSVEKREALTHEIAQLERAKATMAEEVSMMSVVALSPEVKKYFLENQGKITELTERVALSVSNAQLATTDQARFDYAVQAVRISLKQMIASTDTAEPNQAAAGESDFYGLVNTLSNTIKTLKVNIAEPDRLVTNVKAIVTSNNNVIALTEGLIVNAEPATKARLAEMLQSMKVQAEKVLQGGRALNAKFEDGTLQAKLLHEISVLETQANQLLADAGEAFSINSLRYYAKSAAAGIIKLAAMSRSALRVMPENDARGILVVAINSTLTEVSELVPVISAAGKNPHNKRYQIDLLKASVKALAKFSELVLATKRGGRYITDPNLKQDLAFCSNEIVELNKKLETACSSVADLGGQREIEEALEVFLNVNSDLEALQVTDVDVVAASEIRDNAFKLLNLAIKSLSGATDKFSDQVRVGGNVINPIKEASSSIGQVSLGVRSMITTVSDKDVQARMISSAKAVSGTAYELLTSGRMYSMDLNNKNKKKEFDKIETDFKTALATLVASARGIDARDCDDALQSIREAVKSLSGNDITATSYNQATEGVMSNAKVLSSLISQLVATTKTNPTGLGGVSKIIASTVSQLTTSISAAASATNDKGLSFDILQAARLLTDNILRLLNCAKEAGAAGDELALESLNSLSTTASNELTALLGILDSSSNDAEEIVKIITDELDRLEKKEFKDVQAKTSSILLHEINSNVKKFTQVFTKLMTTGKSSGKFELLGKMAATTMGSILSTARSALKSASNSDGASDDANSNDVVVVAKCMTLIINEAQDGQKVVAATKKAAVSVANLINKFKEAAKSVTDKQRQAVLVKNIKGMADAMKKLAQSAPGVVRKEAGAGEAVSEAAKELRERTLDAEKLVTEGDSTVSKTLTASVDSSTANRLAETSKAAALGLIGAINRIGASLGGAKNRDRADSSAGQPGDVTEAIRKLLAVAAVLNPAVRECEKADQAVSAAITDLDDTFKDLTLNQLNIKIPNKSPQEIQRDLIDVTHELDDMIRQMGEASGKPDDLRKLAEELQGRIPIATKILKAVVATTSEINKQQSLLHAAKDLLEAMSSLIKSCSSTDNDSSAQTDQASLSVAALLNALQGESSLAADCQDAASHLHAYSDVAATPAENPEAAYSAYRAELTTGTKDLASVLMSFSSASASNGGQLSLNLNRLKEIVPKMVDMARGMVATTTDETAKGRISSAMKSLVDELVQMCLAAEGFLNNPEGTLPNALRDYINNTNTYISNLIAGAKRGAVGEYVMNKVLEDMNKLTAGLTTSAIFAQAGQLDVSKEAAQHSIQSLQTNVTENTAKLPALITELESRLKVNEERVASTSKKLAEATSTATKFASLAASRFPDALTQQDILNAAKALSLGLQQLLLSAKDAQKSSDPNVVTSFSKAKNSITEAVAQLNSVLTLASGEFARAEKELEAAKKAILQSISAGLAVKAKPEDVAAALRKVIDSGSNVVVASTQEELIDAAQASSLDVEKFINFTRGVCALTDDESLKDKITSSSHDVANKFLTILELAKLDIKDAERQIKLADAIESVMTSVHNSIEQLKVLPGADNLSLGIADSAQLEQQVAIELQSTAKVVKEVGSSLQKAKGKEVPNVDPVVTSAVISASEAIVNATGILVEAALKVQQGQQTRKFTPPAWAQNRLTAAKGVAQGLRSLYSASTDTKFSGDSLVNSAQSVASSTAQLVAALRTRTEASELDTLNTAARSVAKATDELVRAAQRVKEFEDGGDVIGMDADADDDALEELNQQVKILALEKQLRSANAGLNKIRKLKDQN